MLRYNGYVEESMTFNERFALIVDHESDIRLNNKLKKLINSAKLQGSLSQTS